MIITTTTEETKAHGTSLGSSLEAGSVIALLGDLGAGKTTFVKGVVEGFGENQSKVTSPTFTYLNIYDTQPIIYHFDLYRLKKPQEFLDLGFLDHLGSSEGICLIEWAENIKPLLPKSTLFVDFEHLRDGKRKITVYKQQS